MAGYPYGDPEDSGPGRPDTATPEVKPVENVAPATTGAVTVSEATSAPPTVTDVGGTVITAPPSSTSATPAPPPAESPTVTPTSAPKPGAPSFFDALRPPAEVTEGLYDIRYRQKGEMDEIRRRSESVLADDARTVRQAFEASSHGADTLKPWNEQEAQRKYASDPIGAFGSLGSLFAMVASAFTNAPMTNSLNGMASAMDAIKANDELAYNRAYRSWKDNTELAIKRHNMQREAYSDAMNMAKFNQDAFKIKMQNAAARFKDEQALFLLNNGLDQELFGLLEARDKQMKGTAEAYKTITQIGLEAAMVQSSPMWQNAEKEEDPGKKAAMKLRAWMDARNMTANDTITQLMGQYMWANPEATPKEMADFYNTIRWASASKNANDPFAREVQAIEDEYQRRAGTDNPMSLDEKVQLLQGVQRRKNEKGGNINDPINAQQRELNRQRDAGEITPEEWSAKTAANASLKRAAKSNPSDPIQAMQAELNRQLQSKEITQDEFNTRSTELAKLKRTNQGNAADPVQAQQMELNRKLENGDITHDEWKKQSDDLIKLRRTSQGNANDPINARMMKLEQDLKDGTITRDEYEAKAKALQAEKKANNSGATALTAERQIAADVAKAREKWAAEGLTDEEIRDKAAELTRNLRAKSAPITANRRDQLDSMVQKWKVSSNTIDKIEALLKKHGALTGLGGTITRPYEVVTNWFGSNETDRAQFRSYIEELREWGPRLLNESQSRPLSAEAKRIEAIIPGLNPGDTTVNTAKRLLELQKLGRDFQTDLIRRRDSLPPTITTPTEPGAGTGAPASGRGSGPRSRWQDAPIVAPAAADKRSDIMEDTTNESLPFTPGAKYAMMETKRPVPTFEAEKLAGASPRGRGGSSPVQSGPPAAPRQEPPGIEKIEMPGGGQDVKVLVNPTEAMIRGFAAQTKDYRSINANGNWYYWDASKAIHNYVTRKLGIKEEDVRSGSGGSSKDLLRMYDEHSDLGTGPQYASARQDIESRPSNRTNYEKTGRRLPADPSYPLFGERFGDWYNDPMTMKEMRRTGKKQLQELMTNARERNESFFERLDRTRGLKHDAYPGGLIPDPENPLFSRREVRRI